MMVPPLYLAIYGFCILAVLVEGIAFAQDRNRSRMKLVGALALLVVGITAVIQQRNPLLMGAPMDPSGFPVSWVLTVMFLGVLLGIAAKVLFEKRTFHWTDFARPAAISPIVLLPLIGTLDSGDVQLLQLVSLFILAFQNGFFWQKVIENVGPMTTRRNPLQSQNSVKG